MKRVLAFVLTAMCSGCFFGQDVVKLDQPRAHRTPAPEWRSEFDRDISKPQLASLGDTMFVVTRYRLDKEVVAVAPPPSLQQLPSGCRWSVTHTVGDDDILTCPDYYHGTIGIVATKDERLAAKPQMIQVDGVKRGRRWPIRALDGDSLYFRPHENVEVWGVRYGGRHANTTDLQIIDRVNPTVTQVIQDLNVSDSDLASGALIKGVLVTLTGAQSHGAIAYSLVDVEQEGRGSRAEDPR